MFTQKSFKIGVTKWLLFKLLNLLFENEVLGYNGPHFHNMTVNNSSIMSTVTTKLSTWSHVAKLR